MKRRPAQSEIAEIVQRWANQRVAMHHESLTKKGIGKIAWRGDALHAYKMYREPELLMKFLDGNLKAQSFDDVPHIIGCELAILHLEDDRSLPLPLRKFVVELLRGIIQIPQRGDLTFRDGEIVIMLLESEKAGLPLFPSHRDGRKKGQTYGCDIVVKAFKNAGIRMSVATVKDVWRRWSPRSQVQAYRNENREFSKTNLPTK